MSDLLTIPGPLVQFRSEKALTPGMQALVLRIGHAIDQRAFQSDVVDAVWLMLPAADVRGGRDDNHWLRQWMRRLMAVQIDGFYRGQPWAAVLVAEWKLIHNGATLAVLVPPGAVNALRAPETFTKVEEHCLLRLTGAARDLYLCLADKKRLRKSSWRFELGELRGLLGRSERKAYGRWNDFRRWVLDPAVARINDFGTVNVTMTPVRHGRSVAAVDFEWVWKSVDEARETSEEADRPLIARRRPVDGPRDAPPLTDAAPAGVGLLAPAEPNPPGPPLSELLEHWRLRGREPG